MYGDFKKRNNTAEEEAENIPIDSRLFSMKKELAFSQIYKKVFPENYTLPNDYEFDITPLAFADENCFYFRCQ
ncbi:MAG: hypothetical protein V8T45_04330 [Oscillospiraceae bacterium]